MSDDDFAPADGLDEAEVEVQPDPVEAEAAAPDEEQAEENPAAPKKIKKADRVILALELRKQGLSYRRIAKQMREFPGISSRYSEGAAYLDCMEAMRDKMKHQQELAEQNLRLDLERLDELLARLWPEIMDRARPDPIAVNQTLAVLDRRANLLNYKGLDKTVKPTLNVDVTKLSLDQLERLANGEDPYIVLTTPSPSAAGNPPPINNESAGGTSGSE